MATIDFGREVCGDLAAADAREWLVTNGIGGFASGTVAGTLTRRYHGLLVAALTPPVGRSLLVTKIDETLTYGRLVQPLSTNRWASGAIEPAGYVAIERFYLDGTAPVWTYAIADALIEKRVWMTARENVTHVSYALVRGTMPVSIDLAVMVNYRDFHGTTVAGDWGMDVTAVAGGVRVVAFFGATPILVRADRGDVRIAHEWYRDYALARETERGLPDREDHLHAVTFEAVLRAPGDTFAVELRAGDGDVERGDRAWEARGARDRALLTAARDVLAAGDAPLPDWIERLVLAADQFVVSRPIASDPDAASIVAGYPWFGDWGRDTMIALAGITLATGRAPIAATILRTFARFIDGGMLPNYFPDAGQAPEYNTVDAALWFVEAVRRYDAQVADETLAHDLYPALVGIADAYERGTRYHIGVDPSDGLVYAGESGVQLTWMDAKVGDWVVTPRIGKPVEINALWYNALRTLAAFASRFDDAAGAHRFSAAADRVAASFARFWNDGTGACFDVLDGPAGDDPALRPNQLFAVSLEHRPFAPDRQRAIVAACGRRLLTAYGLRSLAPDDPAYRGRYGGTVLERDGAYHQGTAWGWLVGPWVEASLRTGVPASVARSYLEPFVHHLQRYGVGTLAEIADGDAPFAPNGCIAQAWTVAEVLRAWHACRNAST